MRLEWLELRDFRNHRRTAVDRLTDGLTVVVGPNGEGKTNLLEGMFFLYALRSPRASTNAPLVREGADVAYARGEFAGIEGKALVEVEIPRKGASKVKLNKSPLRRKRELRRQVRSVLFGPFDLPVVIGDPSKRRDLMDDAVVALWPLQGGAVHRVRARAPAAQPAPQGMGRRARRPGRRWRRGTRSSSAPGCR